MAIENFLPLLGTVAFGPMGGAVGTAAAGAIGMGRAKGFESEYNQADKNVHPIDPMQLAYMNELKRQEKTYRAGTDPSAGFAMSGVRDTGAQTMSNIRRAGGGVGDLLRSQRVSDRGYAEISARSSGIANQLLGMRGGVVNDISDRVFGEQKYHRGMKYAQWQNAQQDANNNIQAGVGMLAQGIPDEGLFGDIDLGAPKRGSFGQGGAGGSAGPARAPIAPKVGGGGMPYSLNDPYGVPREALQQNLYGAPAPVARPVMQRPYGQPGADPNSPYTPWAGY